MSGCPDCVCNCDAARAEAEVERLRAALEALSRMADGEVPSLGWQHVARSMATCARDTLAPSEPPADAPDEVLTYVLPEAGTVVAAPGWVTILACKERRCTSYDMQVVSDGERISATCTTCGKPLDLSVSPAPPTTVVEQPAEAAPPAPQMCPHPNCGMTISACDDDYAGPAVVHCDGAIERAKPSPSPCPAEPRQFPVLLDYRVREKFPHCPRSVPWTMLAPYEAQARQNHSQTLERLAARGGLCPSEMLAIIDGKGVSPRSTGRCRLGPAADWPRRRIQATM